MWLFKKKEYNSDEELLQHYKKSGNKEVFADLFKKHVSVVYGTCLFYLKDKDEAQDATMQLFEKLMLDINNREIDNFKGWLSFVVRNHCISLIRKNKSQTKNIKSYYEFEYEDANYEEEEKINAVSDDIMLESMTLCLPKLKENQRNCIELFYLKNKSYQDIANETGFTLNEIKSYIQNGKRNLKLLMTDISTPRQGSGAAPNATKNQQTRLFKMLDPKDISDYTHLPKERQRSLEKQMQQDDLSYLSSVAFEEFKVTTAEIDKLNKRVDKKTNKPFTSFNTIFVSVLCGLFIGISVFFVIFQKSKTHPSVLQVFEEEETAAKTLNNTITSTDTLFPEVKPQPVIEHYNTIANNPEVAKPVELPEMLPVKTPLLPEPESEEGDIILQFIPNAPIVFISNLKVTNYRSYYFKRNEAIDLSVNTGLSAQYENNASVEHAVLNKSNAYQAHRIIQKAMRLFNSKNIANCIEELNLLYNFNNDDANAQFYLGMCYFQLGKYNFAQNYFQRNLDNENNIFHQESEFYQALCLLNTKQTDRALEQLQHIAAGKGFYAPRAQEVLNKQVK